MTDAAVVGRLRGAGLSGAAVHHAMCVWKHYRQHYADADADADERERARGAWQRLVTARGWRPTYVLRARTALLRVLSITAPVQAQALRINAVGRPRRIFTQSSHETQFYVHDCLPRAVRRLPATALRYRLLFFVVERLVEHLRSACRRSLQKKMNFVERVLYTEPALVCGEDLQGAVAGLRLVRAAAWLGRLDLAYPGSGVINPKLFRSHVLLLNLLHGRVFECVDRTTASIPVTVGVTVCSCASSCDEASSFANGDDDPEADESWRLQQHVKRLQGRICKQQPQRSDVATAFTPEEVLAIVERAVTNEERLVINLLISTGVRIGGLCRIRSASRWLWAAEVPTTGLSTVEKGNVPRVLQINAGIKLLLPPVVVRTTRRTTAPARWFREDRPPDSRLVFPSARNPDQPVSTSYMWRTVRGVLRRADVGHHHHPHTFRHTFVHMMTALGVSSEVIAKFVGHRNVATTTGVYGRLTAEEMGALAATCPLIGDETAACDLADRWRCVIRRLQRPYHFSERELQGLRVVPT